MVAYQVWYAQKLNIRVGFVNNGTVTVFDNDVLPNGGPTETTVSCALNKNLLISAYYQDKFQSLI